MHHRRLLNGLDVYKRQPIISSLWPLPMGTMASMALIPVLSLIHIFTLQFNRARQGAITRELTEMVAGDL